MTDGPNTEKKENTPDPNKKFKNKQLLSTHKHLHPDAKAGYVLRYEYMPRYCS